MKLKTKIKDCKLLVKVKAAYGDQFDVTEIDQFKRLYLRGFLKPQEIKKKKVLYSGPASMSMCDFLMEPISKRDFLLILEQTVLTLQKIYANRLRLNNLIMDIKKVYINRNTKELQFLYIPGEWKMKSSNIVEFIKSIIYTAKVNDVETQDVISRFAYFFNNMAVIDTDEIEKFVNREDRSVVQMLKKQNAGQSGFMTNKQMHYYEHYSNDKEKIGDSPTETFSEQKFVDEGDDATGLLEDLPTDLLEPEDDATGLLTEQCYENRKYDEKSNTECIEQYVQAASFPSLTRTMTQERIQINKPVYRIGKEKSYVDYFISNNPLISRSHADIITRSGKYYVKDLNSKNRTFINGWDIGVNNEVQIHEGDRLTLANEDFIFNVAG